MTVVRRELTEEETAGVAEIAAACAVVASAADVLTAARDTRAVVIRGHRALVTVLGPTRVSREVAGCVSEGTIRAVLKADDEGEEF